MANLNNVTISGNLTADATIRKNLNNPELAFVDFRIAVNDPRNKNGESYVSFFDCSRVGNAQGMERLANALRKGVKVGVQGRLRQNRWQAKDGSKRSNVNIYVNEIEFMTRVQNGDMQPQGGNGNQVNRSHASASQQGGGSNVYYDQDIPF